MYLSTYPSVYLRRESVCYRAQYCIYNAVIDGRKHVYLLDYRVSPEGYAKKVVTVVAFWDGKQGPRG